MWVGKFRPTYPMYWRYVFALYAIITTPITGFFIFLNAWPAVLVINGVVLLILGLSYLWAAWLTHRPKGGPECLFAVTEEGAHYHAGSELRDMGQITAATAAAVTGKLHYLLMRKGARACDDLFIPWADVKSVEILPTMRLVYVSRGLYGPVPLFCTEENFDAVRNFVLAHAPHARSRAGRHSPFNQTAVSRPCPVSRSRSAGNGPAPLPTGSPRTVSDNGDR